MHSSPLKKTKQLHLNLDDSHVKPKRKKNNVPLFSQIQCPPVQKMLRWRRQITLLTKLQALSFYERNLDYSSKFYETQLQIKLYFKSMREDNIKAGMCATITLRRYTAHYRSPSSNGKESIKILFQTNFIRKLFFVGNIVGCLTYILLWDTRLSIVNIHASGSIFKAQPVEGIRVQ